MDIYGYLVSRLTVSLSSFFSNFFFLELLLGYLVFTYIKVLINLQPDGYVSHLCKQWKNCVTQFIYNPIKMDVDTDVNPDVNMDVNPDVNTDEMSQNSSPPR